MIKKSEIREFSYFRDHEWCFLKSGCVFLRCEIGVFFDTFPKRASGKKKKCVVELVKNEILPQPSKSMFQQFQPCGGGFKFLQRFCFPSNFIRYSLRDSTNLGPSVMCPPQRNFPIFSFNKSSTVFNIICESMYPYFSSLCFAAIILLYGAQSHAISHIKTPHMKTLPGMTPDD